MPRMILRNGVVMIEDHARGDWREATPQEKINAHIELPDKIANSVAQATTGETYDPTTSALNPARRLWLINLARDMNARRATLVGLGYDVTDIDGMQWAKLKGTKTWRPVDPAMGQGGLGEAVLDLFDLTTDVLKAVATTAGAAVGTAAGAPLAVASGGAAPILGAMGGGGMAYTGVEMGRQALGHVTGIKENIAPEKAIEEGAMVAPLSVMPPAPVRIPTGFSVPQVPSMLGKAWGAAKGGALTLSSKIAGTKPELLSMRAKIPGFGRLPTGRAAALKLKEVLDGLDSGAIRIPARQAADDIVGEAEKQGAKVDMTPMFDAMQEYMLAAREAEKETTKRVVIATEESFKKATRQAGTKGAAGSKLRRGERMDYTAEVPEPVPYHTLDTIQAASDRISSKASTAGTAQSEVARTTTRKEMVEESVPRTAESARAGILEPNMHKIVTQVYSGLRQYADMSGEKVDSMSPKFAEEIKRLVQEVADGKGAWGEYEVTKQAASKLSSFSKIGRKQIEDKMVATGVVDPKTGKNYAETMVDVSRAMDYWGRVRRGYFAGKDEAQKIGRAIRTIRGLHGETGHELLDAVEMLDNEIGTNVYETVRQAALGKAMGETFGEFGKPNIIPRFTASGRLLGPSMLPTPGAMAGGAGYLTAGPAGAVAGVGYASPATQLALVKAAQAMPAVRAGTAARLNDPRFRQSVITAISAAASRRSGEPSP